MKALSALGLGILLLGGCKEVKKTGDLPAAESAKLRELTVMEGYPEGFAGCSCSYARTRGEYRQQRLVYLEKFGMVDSTQNFKMISLDGASIRWYSGENPEGFTVEVLQDSEEQADQEVREIEGRLVIRFSDGREVSTPVYGVCGC